MFDALTGVLLATDQSLPIRLFSYLPKWLSITMDRWVFSIIAHDYPIEFENTPPAMHFVHTPHSQLLAGKAISLLQMDVIERVPTSLKGTGFYSHYFTVPKRDGGIRPIMDLRLLNLSIAYKCFRMMSL